jgi:hypothetical protein
MALVYHDVPRMGKITTSIIFLGVFSNCIQVDILILISILRLSAQDLLMHYHWGLGVGHLHAHQPRSTSSFGYGADGPDLSENHQDLLTNLEPKETQIDSYESDNPELWLEIHDSEGWEDMETDSEMDGSISSSDGSGGE